MKASRELLVTIGVLSAVLAGIPLRAGAITPTSTATPCPTGTPCGGEFQKICPPGALAGDSCLCSCTACPTCPAGQIRACTSYECSCECRSASPTPTPCPTFPEPQLDFHFSVDPPHPGVGDAVQVSVSVSGRGGIPAYSLSGASPIFDGDTSTMTSNQLGTVTYHLTAVHAGTAVLSLSVNYETSVGCVDQPIFEFVTATSPVFSVVVASQSPTPTPTASVTPAACVGDCGNDDRTTVDEIVTMVAIALDQADVSNCPSGDANRDDRITVDELLVAVNNALSGCHLVGVGGHCGGFVPTPAVCAPGLVCQLTPIPDAGGVCVTAAAISVSPSGGQLGACAGTFAITLTNTGPPGTTLHINSATLTLGYSQGYYGTGFEWDTSQLAFPVTVPSSGTVTIPVSFTAGPGSDKSRLELTIESDAANAPHLFTAYLTGSELTCGMPTPTPSPPTR